MRFAAGIVASAGLAALATASSAAIYELNIPAASGPALDVSPEQARLGISLALGVSRFYKLGAQDSSDKQVEVLERFGRLENRIGLTPNDEGRFVLSLAGIGMEDADGLPLNQPVMVMKNAPSGEATGKMLKQIAEEKSETLSQPLQEITTLHNSYCVATPNIPDAERIVSDYKFKNFRSWSVGEENKGISKEMTSVFNPDRSPDRHFISEYLLFRAFVEKLAPRMSEDKDTFAFCHFQGIEELIVNYGQESTEVNLALSLYHNALVRLSKASAIKTTLLLTPVGGSGHFKEDSHKHSKRMEMPLSASGFAALTEPSPATAKSLSKVSAPIAPLDRFKRVYGSRDACMNGTNSCSGHGKCVEGIKNSWSCLCKPTVVKNKGKISTTHWGGFSCQKKDISVPFNLFFLFTVIMLLVLVWAIQLLFSVGDEPLPSVLSAGVAPPKRA